MRNIYSLVLVAAALVLADGQVVFTVKPLGQDRYTLQQGVSAEQEVPINTTGILFSTLSGNVQWYSVYSNVSAAQAALKPANTTTVVGAGPNLFRAIVPSHAPGAIYYGVGSTGSSSYFVCDIVVFGPFTCSSGGQVIATFAAMGTENADINPNVQLPVVVSMDPSHPMYNALSNSMLSLAFHRAFLLRQLWDNGNAIVNSDFNRISSSRNWGGGIMLVISVAMEAMLVMMVTISAWLMSSKRLSKRTSFLLWLLCIFVIQQIVSILGGFPGWFAMFVIITFIFLIFLIIYAIARVCYAKKQQVMPFDNAKVIRPSDIEEGGGRTPPALATPTDSKAKWSTFPDELGTVQKAMLIALGVGMMSLLVICLLAFYTWNPKEYQLWDRRTWAATVEFAPSTVGKSTLLMYMFPRMATVLNFNVFAVYSTKYCGYRFSQTLTTDSDKKTAIFDDFIDLYGLDMTQYARPSYTQYSSVNDWFTRSLAPGARPIAAYNNTNIAVSPADSRLMVFENINSDLHVWLKNEEFKPSTLMGLTDSAASAFAGGTMVVARLAPADYHRFHSPATGQLGSWTNIDGTILSVNADAATSGNSVYYNTRKVAVIDTPNFGKIAYVAIGATCVGSVIVGVQNQGINKGDEVGIMQFGGSTVVMLFQPGKIVLDSDLLFNSRRGLETRVYMGERIGVAATPV